MPFRCGLVAQLVEQCPFKALVRGSSPRQPTISISPQPANSTRLSGGWVTGVFWEMEISGILKVSFSPFGFPAFPLSARNP